MDVGCTGLRLDYRLRPWAPTSASRAISAVAELLVYISNINEQTSSLLFMQRLS